MEPILLESGKIPHPKKLLLKSLLLCGIVSSLWYAVINIIVPAQFAGYSVTSQTISELSAIDAPTRTIWVELCIFYTLLLIAFGLGVGSIASHNKKLRLTAAVIVIDAIFTAFWPPMHQREVIAAGGGTITDTLHYVWAFIHLALVLLMIGFGTVVMGKKFRIYSIATVVVFIIFGILTTQESSGIATAKPTPHIGIWERVNIGAYMLWIAVFAIAHLQAEKIRNSNITINPSIR